MITNKGTCSRPRVGGPASPPIDRGDRQHTADLKLSLQWLALCFPRWDPAHPLGISLTGNWIMATVSQPIQLTALAAGRYQGMWQPFRL